MSTKGKPEGRGLPKREGLSKPNWSFEDVPEGELAPCCYWEYARESARIRAAFDPEDKVFFPNPVPTYVVSPTGQRLKTGSVINTARARFTDRLRENALPVLEIFHRAIGEVSRPFDSPWLTLSVAVRQAVIAELAPYYAEKPGLAFLPFNRCSDLRDLGIADGEYRCAEFDAELGIERLRVEIDWGGFTDGQIVAAFKVWVAENRPGGIGSADHRGRRKKKGYRAYLAWLGIMRLMNRHSFTSMEREFPEGWKLYRGADWPRARGKARTIFRELFPFLPDEDKPIHWDTAGGRAK
jgi:hypothetical protein